MLVRKADLKAGQDVLDIGCGCGDSTAVLADFQPRSLQGITSEQSQCSLAKKRFRRIEFLCADAVEHVAGLTDQSVDRIIALDCMYHFYTRFSFLRDASRVLRDNGRMTATDLLLGDKLTIFERLLMRLICFLTVSPFCNFMTAREYAENLSQAGFEQLEIEDISRHVFPGLSEFIILHKRELGIYGISGKWIGYLVFARVLRWWWTSKAVKFVIVNAQRSSM